MRLVEGWHVGVGEDGLRQLPEEGLDEGGDVVGGGAPEGRIDGGGRGVELSVQRPSQLLRLGPAARHQSQSKTLYQVR